MDTSAKLACEAAIVSHYMELRRYESRGGVTLGELFYDGRFLCYTKETTPEESFPASVYELEIYRHPDLLCDVVRVIPDGPCFTGELSIPGFVALGHTISGSSLLGGRSVAPVVCHLVQSAISEAATPVLNVESYTPPKVAAV